MTKRRREAIIVGSSVVGIVVVGIVLAVQKPQIPATPPSSGEPLQLKVIRLPLKPPPTEAEIRAQQVMDRQREIEAAQLAKVADRKSKMQSEWDYSKERIEAVCRNAFREKLTGLDPTELLSGGSDPDGYGFELRFVVRLADSFRAAPVGIVRCRVDSFINTVHLEKVRM